MTDDPFADIRNLEAAGIPRQQAETLIRILWEVRAAAQADGVYNAIAAMRRLESAGFARPQAETLAAALVDVFADARQFADRRAPALAFPRDLAYPAQIPTL